MKISFAIKFAITTFVLVIGLGAGDAYARIDNYRYYPDDNRFSISMGKEEDRFYREDKQISLPDRDIVEFRFSPAATIRGIFGFRSIEWLKLSQPISRWQLDAIGRAMLTDYATAHFGADHPFTIQSEQFLPSSSPPSFKLVATGTLGESPAEIRAIVLDFDTDVAMVCEYFAPADVNHVVKAEKIEPDFIDWAMSIRKEPVAAAASN